MILASILALTLSNAPLLAPMYVKKSTPGLKVTCWDGSVQSDFQSDFDLHLGDRLETTEDVDLPYRIPGRKHIGLRLEKNTTVICVQRYVPHGGGIVGRFYFLVGTRLVQGTIRHWINDGGSDDAFFESENAAISVTGTVLRLTVKNGDLTLLVAKGSALVSVKDANPPVSMAANSKHVVRFTDGQTLTNYPPNPLEDVEIATLPFDNPFYK